MRVVKVTPMSGEFVEFAGPHFETDYIRFAPGNWMVRMGESWETSFDEDSLEAAYQAWHSAQNMD